MLLDMGKDEFGRLPAKSKIKKKFIFDVGSDAILYKDSDGHDMRY